DQDQRGRDCQSKRQENLPWGQPPFGTGFPLAHSWTTGGTDTRPGTEGEDKVLGPTARTGDDLVLLPARSLDTLAADAFDAVGAGRGVFRDGLGLEMTGGTERSWGVLLTDPFLEQFYGVLHKKARLPVQFDRVASLPEDLCLLQKHGSLLVDLVLEVSQAGPC